MPGPVFLTPPVQAALEAKTISHRSDRFKWIHEDTRRMLCRLTDAQGVTIALGSGTLANDMIAGQLSQLEGRGLILSNGEFGERLIDHARQFNLDFDTVETEWGAAFNRNDLLRALSGDRRSWLWAVHAETSTGVLNDIDLLKQLCRDSGIALCLDCVSSLGMVKTDLSDLYLASGVSGKGLAALAGIALVFHNHDIQPPVRLLPRYLDLYRYHSLTVPYTLTSNLLNALHTALEKLDPDERWPRLHKTAQYLNEELLRVGLSILADESIRFTGALTIPLPKSMNSLMIGAELDEAGMLVSYRSDYLLKRNWIQICLMNDPEPAALQPLFQILRDQMRDIKSPMVS
jgi:aspartate aminotransferase-like enzyme